MICDAPSGIINKLIVFLGIGLMGLMANLVHAGNWWESDWEIHSPRWSEDNGSGSWGEFWTHSNNSEDSMACWCRRWQAILVEQAHKVSDSKEGQDIVVVMTVDGTVKEPS